MRKLWFLPAILLFLLVLIPGGCGSEGGSTFKDDASIDAQPEAEIPFPPFPTIDAPACKNLECKQVACTGSAKTTISGVVYDPAGKVPLYNVIVYVPNAPVAPLPEGASCDKCTATLSGDPLVTALTNTKGEFVLENVPVGNDIPLVIQIGKWRRIINVPATAACTDTALTDKNLTRMPRNQSEGNIPRFALTTGGADALECLLRKIGLDDSEFTNESGTGRIHLFQGVGGGTLAGGVTGVQQFWSDINKMKKYDVLLLSCEGAEYPENKPATALQALQDYTSLGGRVFASHFHYYWLEDGVQPFPTVATWNHAAWPPNPYPTLIDMSFPKGAAFAEWLVNVGGSTTLGQLSISEARNDVSAVNPATSQRWIYGINPTSVQYLTFNTPVGINADAQCGRVVYSDLHVGSGDTPGRQFPAGCVTQDLTPQQKALEFMLFDLSACVQKDNEVPKVPSVR